MIKVSYGLLTFSLLAGLSHAQSTHIHSRNMPFSCDYVFQVESDIEMNFQGLSAGERIRLAQINEWEKEKGWQWASETVPLVVQENGDARLAWTLQSMNWNQYFLYRRYRFYFSSKPETIYEFEFGREFGESCVRSGRNGTPFRERTVVQLQ